MSELPLQGWVLSMVAGRAARPADCAASPRRGNPLFARQYAQMLADTTSSTAPGLSHGPATVTASRPHPWTERPRHLFTDAMPQ